MADQPSSKAGDYARIVVVIVIVGAVIWGLTVLISKPGSYSESYCQTAVPVSADSTVLSVIQEASEKSDATPINIDSAIRNAPPDTLGGNTAMICFDETKQHVSSVNGKLVPRDD